MPQEEIEALTFRVGHHIDRLREGNVHQLLLALAMHLFSIFVCYKIGSDKEVFHVCFKKVNLDMLFINKNIVHQT